MVLKIRDLHVRFRQPGKTVHAVRGCSIEIDEGEIVGLVGESGCGKSITALACLGLVPESGEVTGSVEVCGKQVVNRSDEEMEGLRGGVATIIFQNPMAAMNPFFTIEKQMTDAIRAHLTTSQSEARKKAVEALSSVQIPDPNLALQKYPHQLSGGQLQRVMIAMAVACEPRILIADEPTTALDVTVQAQVLVLIRDLAAETGLTILFITHDLGVVATLCNRVSVMYAGQIVESGSVEQIFKSGGHPYTAKLMHTVPNIGAEKSVLNFIPGQVPDLSLPVEGCAFAARCEKVTEICRKQRPLSHTIDDSHYVLCHNVPGASILDPVKEDSTA